MATFRERTLKSGKTSITAQIVRRNPPYQESKTFDKRKTAETWAKRREAEIDAQIKDGAIPTKRSTQRRTLGDAIDRYVADNRKAMGSTKAQVLRTIRKEYDIASLPCDKITSVEIAEFANQLWDRPGVNSAATVDNYLQSLSAVVSVARVLWGFPLDEQAMKDAMKATAKLGTRGRSEKRTRRPTLAELDRLMTLFQEKSAFRPKSVPMHRVVAFAIFSTRRQDEICRITWDDYDPDYSDDEARVMVRDLKHPGDKIGNDTWCHLPDPCRAIIAAQPKTSDRIFPYTADAVSAAFTRACKFLEIEDLHFHDLRHEGTSRLFEMGWNVDRVADVTAHRSWDSLRRYRQYKRAGDKFTGWEWLDVVTLAGDGQAITAP